MFEVLEQSPLFKGLNREQIGNLIDQVPHQIKQFERKEVLGFTGDPVDRALLLLEGRLQGEMLDATGNSLKIEEIAPPQMVASAFLYGPQGRFPVNLSAITEGKLLVVHKREFTKLLSLDTRLLTNYLNIISGKAQFLSQKIVFLSLKTIREKVAHYLIEQAPVAGDRIALNVSQKGLSELLGVARPSLARTIAEMEDANLIRWERNEVILLNRQELKMLIRR